jgi:hypothetical protein
MDSHLLYKALDEGTRQRYNDLVKEKLEKQARVLAEIRKEDTLAGSALCWMGFYLLGVIAAIFWVTTSTVTNEIIDALALPAMLVCGIMAFIFFFLALLSCMHYP